MVIRAVAKQRTNQNPVVWLWLERRGYMKRNKLFQHAFIALQHHGTYSSLMHLFLSSGREFSRSDFKAMRSDWRPDICWTMPGADTYVDSPTWASGIRRANKRFRYHYSNNHKKVTNTSWKEDQIIRINGYLSKCLVGLEHNVEKYPDHPLLPVLELQKLLE